MSWREEVEEVSGMVSWFIGIGILVKMEREREREYLIRRWAVVAVLLPPYGRDKIDMTAEASSIRSRDKA